LLWGLREVKGLNNKSRLASTEIRKKGEGMAVKEMVPDTALMGREED